MKRNVMCINRMLKYIWTNNVFKYSMKPPKNNNKK